MQFRNTVRVSRASLATALITAAVVTHVKAAIYSQLAPGSVIVNGTGDSFSAGTTLGSNAYAVLAGNGTSQISSTTTGVGVTPTSSTFTSSSALAGVGVTTGFGGQLWDSGNGFFDILDNFNDQILHIDQGTGTPTQVRIQNRSFYN